MKRNFLAILLALTFVAACFPFGVARAFTEMEPTASITPTISVENVFAKPGTTVNVNVNITDNTGIAGARLRLA